jgi:enoyl-CoA hydratase/carnithine racemase|tara:strand:- start:524 stop:1306 length:783 start_codon:yes stop_codon:yes gene_type:complete
MVLIETEDYIRTLTLNRPKSLNAFNQDIWDELTAAIIDASEDNAVKVVVITGAGRAFSAGADLSQKSDGPRKREGSPIGEPITVRQFVDHMIEFPKPIIVAVNGLGVGIGATICGLADISYMAESARLRCPFSSLGITAEGASTYTYANIMGRQAASWFLLGAEWMSSSQCKDANLVLDVFPDDTFMENVIERAAILAKMPMASLLETKALLMAPHRDGMHAANARETEALARLSGGPANREAISAFIEKREPDFSGLEE